MSPSRMNFNKSSRISRESSVVYNCRLLETRTRGSSRKKTCLHTVYPYDPFRSSIQTRTVSSGRLFYDHRELNKLQTSNIEIWQGQMWVFVRNVFFARTTTRVALSCRSCNEKYILIVFAFSRETELNTTLFTPDKVGSGQLVNMFYSVFDNKPVNEQRNYARVPFVNIERIKLCLRIKPFDSYNPL